MKAPQLSIVIICWNDWKVLENCLRSIFDGTHQIDYEVIVSDNGSTDGSVERVREQFPMVRLVENRANLGFARGNNAGIKEARGEYILILNPDTICHDGSFDRWISYADKHPQAGAFGCRVLNPDGTYQVSARPFPTVKRSLLAAFFLYPLGRLGSALEATRYEAWKGDSEREVDWQSGCCVMFRGELLKNMGGFDEQFFYHFEEVDLCHRVWKAGYSIRFTPAVTITHLGGQSVSRFPLRFALETSRNRYKYFYKYFGEKGARQARQVMLMHLRIRQAGLSLAYLFRRRESLKQRLDTLRTAARWNTLIDPVAYSRTGAEPHLDV